VTTGEAGVTRRQVLRQLALAVTGAGAGVFNVDAARVVHALAGEARAQAGGYAPAALSAHQFRTVTRLAELIVPADEGGGSAVEAGAPEFIDLLCSQNPDLLRIYADGLAWLDAATRRTRDRTFVDASAAQQTALLDGLVAAERGESSSPDLREGLGFFNWVRRMTVDAYYTSPIGIADVGFQGNRVLGAYSTPREAVEFIARTADELGL
jgi:hypothetical protein